MLTVLVTPDWPPIVAGLVALAGGIFAIVFFVARKRTQALTTVALEIGFVFAGESWKNVPQAPLLQTALFNKGRAKYFQNIMTGSVDRLHASVFDYSYTVGWGRYSRVYNQTVAAYRKNDAALPSFSLYPQGLVHKIWEAMVHKDVAFHSQLDFFRRYYVRSLEKERVNILFTPALLTFLEGFDKKKKWRVEGLSDTLIIYRSGKKSKPEDVRSFLEGTSSLASQFFNLGNCK
jgi:hypothetical protein